MLYIRSLNMLTAIEGCLEQLFETIETLPADKVEAAEKASFPLSLPQPYYKQLRKLLVIRYSPLGSSQLKEKERRMRLRAQKMEEQRLYQELKLRRMQERAQGGPAQTVSLPPTTHTAGSISGSETASWCTWLSHDKPVPPLKFVGKIPSDFISSKQSTNPQNKNL